MNDRPFDVILLQNASAKSAIILSLFGLSSSEISFEKSTFHYFISSKCKIM